MSSTTLQEIVLPNSPTGRRVMKGLQPHTAEYRGRLLGKRSMRRRRLASPATCLQSGNYFLNMYWNATYGCCTGSALVEIINDVYGVQVDPNVALDWFRAHNILDGANELDVLNAAETDPLVVNGQGYVIGPSVTFDYADVEAVKDAISAHKVAYWGVDAGYLQQVVGDVSGWVAPVITTPQTNYDHAVFSPDYGTLDELATYLNKQRGVTVTLGSLDPQMLGCTLDTWDTLGIVPMPTIGNTTGEAHAIESFPAPTPAPGPGPGPGPGPRPTPSRRGLAIMARLNERLFAFDGQAHARAIAMARAKLGLPLGADLSQIIAAIIGLYDSGLLSQLNDVLTAIEKELGLVPA